MKKIDPYKILGLRRNANAADIRAAYRKRSKETHPDIQGDGHGEREFHDVKTSYDVLITPARRAKFDATGTIDEDAVDNTMAHVYQRMTEAFGIVMRVCGERGIDPVTLNMVEVMIHAIEDNTKDRHTAIEQLEQAIAKLERIKVRFFVKDKKGPNQMHMIIQGQIDQARNRAEGEKKEIEASGMAIEILRRFGFDVQPQVQTTYYIMR